MSLFPVDPFLEITCVVSFLMGGEVRHAQCSVSGGFPHPKFFYAEVETYTYEGLDGFEIFELKIEDEAKFFKDYLGVDGDVPSQFLKLDLPGAELEKIEIGVKKPPEFDMADINGGLFSDLMGQIFESEDNTNN